MPFITCQNNTTSHGLSVVKHLLLVAFPVQMYCRKQLRLPIKYKSHMVISSPYSINACIYLFVGLTYCTIIIINYLWQTYTNTHSLMFKECSHWHTTKTHVCKYLGYFGNWSPSQQDCHAKEKVPCRHTGPTRYHWLTVPDVFLLQTLWVAAGSFYCNFCSNLVHFNQGVITFAPVTKLEQQ